MKYAKIMMLLSMVTIFLLLTPFSFVKLFKKNDWCRVVTVLKIIESTTGQLFLKSTTPQPPSPNCTSKEVDQPLHLTTAPRALDYSEKTNYLRKHWVTLIWHYKCTLFVLKDDSSQIGNSLQDTLLMDQKLKLTYTKIKRGSCTHFN